jgi:hypothetical protein
MAKRRSFLGSAPCLGNRSEQYDEQQKNLLASQEIERKDIKWEAQNEPDETIILSHWYRFGFDGGEAIKK